MRQSLAHDEPASDEALLDEIERWAFTYFLQEIDETTGLVRDNTRPKAPASIAGSGFALASYVVGAERGYISRAEAAGLARRALQFLWDAPQSETRDATGSHGFFYHFVTTSTGRRVWDCELSTIDTTIALAGVLTAGVYFDGTSGTEHEICALADAVYRRVEWDWAMAGRRVSMGWHPESGFLRCDWRGYNEALLLYILGLGSETHPLPSASYAAWAETYTWLRVYGHEHLYAGPLFIHQLSATWLDLRGIRDVFMRKHEIDYFENSRRATYIHQEYARRNPRRWAGYSSTCWGVTASDGPGPAIGIVGDKVRKFYGYHGRGVPFGIDDGTLSSWAMVTSLPFAPEIVIPSIRAVAATYPHTRRGYGYTGSFNPSFRLEGHANITPSGWVSPLHYAINQGPVVLMIENYRSELLWRLMCRCRYVATGLRRAGFSGGWLNHPEQRGTRK